MIDQLAGTGVDVLTVVVGINDDLWGKTWGADIREGLPDGGRAAGGAEEQPAGPADRLAAAVDGRIWKTELRLRLTEYAPNLPRIRCEVNGHRVDLRDAAKLRNSEGDEWLVVDNPPLRQGNNAVLVVLEGAEAPDEWVLKMPGVNDGWPTLEQCELVVRSERK